MAPDLPAGWDCHVHVFEAGAAVAGAHYQPVPRPLQDIEALAAAHGCGHLVLVQPSVYGTDNALLLAALQAGAGRHRGVVVLGGAEAEGELRAMHALGVRGLRFNLVSPVGSAIPDTAAALERLAPALRSLGWHVQWYAAPAHLPRIADWQRTHGLVQVLDHLAGLTAAHAVDAGSWRALATLAESGAWIKLSGWYRLQATAPYDTLLPTVRRVSGLFGDRIVWGSDWPHTSFAPQALPAYASTWLPVMQALGAARAGQVREAGSVLYA